mmetsp:Transcript_11466/g.23126  ORF Transcript_11466/g.23126 Transcript_11466/m.23126 type:complete len:231 (+) Transcript_11466:95-787(+)
MVEQLASYAVAQYAYGAQTTHWLQSNWLVGAGLDAPRPPIHALCVCIMMQNLVTNWRKTTAQAASTIACGTFRSKPHRVGSMSHVPSNSTSGVTNSIRYASSTFASSKSLQCTSSDKVTPTKACTMPIAPQIILCRLTLLSTAGLIASAAKLCMAALSASTMSTLGSSSSRSSTNVTATELSTTFDACIPSFITSAIMVHGINGSSAGSMTSRSFIASGSMASERNDDKG